MFKRRTKPGWWRWSKEQVYPRGGFRRAAAYLWHRLRRLPDPPHRIARGVFVGTFVNFPPIFGLQLLAAAGLAFAVRGNVLAALLATFLSNPVTTPLIAVVSLRFGHWMLGTSGSLSMPGLFAAFAGAGAELWHNVQALFGPEVAHWDGLALFWERIYLPYLLGSILPGLVVSAGLAWASLMLTRTYQAMRRRRAVLRRAAKGRDGAPPTP
jgi:uncharacterized protein